MVVSYFESIGSEALLNHKKAVKEFEKKQEEK